MRPALRLFEHETEGKKTAASTIPVKLLISKFQDSCERIVDKQRFWLVCAELARHNAADNRVSS